MKRLFYTITGFISFALGMVGTVLPFIPTVPFLLAAAFCFARSSKKLNDWFTSTSIYKNNLESYVAGKGMTTGAKLRIMSTVTFIMLTGAVVMLSQGIYMPCVVMAAVWVCHVLYFVFGVKTLKAY